MGRMTGGRRAVVFGLLHAGLAIVRSLGRSGVPVGGVALDPSEFGIASRYLRDRTVLGRDGDSGHDAEFLAVLRRHAEHGRPVLFPERDENVELVLRNWEVVQSLADVPFPDDVDVVRRLRRKELLPLEAERAGVPTPLTLVADSEEAIRAAGLHAPFLVKPAEGQGFALAFGHKAVVAQTVDEAVAAWRRAHEHGFDTIVQELVPEAADRIYSYFAYIGRDGSPLAAVVGRKVRQGPLGFGTAAVFEVRYQPVVHELAERLLLSAGYRGFAHVEFAEDRRDGTFKLLEVNTRAPVWGGLVMSRYFDLARVAFLDLCGVEVAPLGVLQTDVSWIYLGKDVWVSLQMARRRELGLRGFAAPYLRARKVRATFAVDDLRPAVASLGYLRSRR
jgi:predicted ATP-grasp superfamily ATP-dependent carboligase